MNFSFDTHAALEQAVKVAETDCRNGHWQQGFERYVEIVRTRFSERKAEHFDEASFAAADAIILERTAEIALLLGEAGVADSLFGGLAVAFARAGNKLASDCAALQCLHLAISLGQRGRIEENLRRLESTIGSFDQIPFQMARLESWERNRRFWVAVNEERSAHFLSRFYLEAGRLLAWVGQYRDSIGALSRGLILAQKFAPNGIEKLRTSLRLELAAAKLEKGELGATDSFLECLQKDLVPDRDPGFAVRYREIAGRVSMMRGNFGHALSELESASEICRRFGFLLGELAAKLNTAELLILVNQTVEARRRTEVVYEAARQLGSEQLQLRAKRLESLAVVRRQSKRGGILIAPPVSEFWRQQSSRSKETPDRGLPVGFDHPEASGFLERFNEYVLGFLWLLDRRETQSAGEWLAQMHEIFAATDSRLVWIRLRVLEGIQCFYNGLVESALDTLVPLCAELRSLGLKHELWQTCQFVHWSQSRLETAKSLRTANFTKESETLLAEMTASLRPEHRAVFLVNKWTAEEEKFSSKLDALVAHHQAVERLAWPFRFLGGWSVANQLHDLELLGDQIRATVAKENLGSEEARKDWKTTSSFLSRLLHHSMRRATLSFFVLPDRVFIVSSTFLSLRFGVTPIGRVELRDLVARLHQAFSRGEGAVLDALRLCEELANILQLSETLRRLPGWVRALTVVPDDVLNGVPFSALLVDGHALVELYAVSVKPSLASKPRKRKAREVVAVTIAGVAEAVGSLPALTGVTTEVRDIAFWFNSRGVQVRQFLNAEATAKNVFGFLNGRSIIHLACHGVFSLDDLEHTGLALLGENGEIELVSLPDLVKLDLQDVEHLTLASCWSADNYLLPGRWILSLPSVALQGGAASVLGSLWPIEDKLSTAFTRRFYEHLATSPRDEALRRTQLECLKNTLFEDDRMNTADGCFWAGFLLVGDPGRVYF